jgi:hypothetical protein
VLGWRGDGKRDLQQRRGVPGEKEGRPKTYKPSVKQALAISGTVEAVIMVTVRVTLGLYSASCLGKQNRALRLLHAITSSLS